MEDDDVLQAASWQDGDHFSPELTHEVFSDDDSPYSQDFVIESVAIAEEDSIWTDFDEVISLGDKLMGFPSSPTKTPKSRPTPGPSSKAITQHLRREAQSYSSEASNEAVNDTIAHSVEPKESTSGKPKRSKIPRIGENRPTSARAAEENVTTHQPSKKLGRKHRSRISKQSSFTIEKLLLGESEDEGQSNSGTDTVDVKHTESVRGYVIESKKQKISPIPSKSAENIKIPSPDEKRDSANAASPSKRERSRAWRYLSDETRLSSPPRYTFTSNDSGPVFRDGSVLNRERLCFSPLATLSGIQDETAVIRNTLNRSNTSDLDSNAREFPPNPQNESSTPESRVRPAETEVANIGSNMQSPLASVDSPAMKITDSPFIDQERRNVSLPSSTKQTKLIVITDDCRGNQSRNIKPDVQEDHERISKRKIATHRSLFGRMFDIITCKSCTETTFTSIN